MDYKIIPMTKDHVAGIKKVDDSCFESPWSLKAFESELENPIAFYLTKHLHIFSFCCIINFDYIIIMFFTVEINFRQ